MQLPDRLTAEGARLLRQVRDHILARPSTFRMDTWDCHTTACIGGHLARILKQQKGYPVLHEDVVNALGFRTMMTPKPVVGHLWVCDGDGYIDMSKPIAQLFYMNMGDHDPQHAATRINSFLWHYGFPADEEVVPPTLQQEEDLCLSR